MFCLSIHVVYNKYKKIPDRLGKGNSCMAVSWTTTVVDLQDVPEIPPRLSRCEYSVDIENLVYLAARFAFLVFDLDRNVGPDSKCVVVLEQNFFLPRHSGLNTFTRDNFTTHESGGFWYCRPTQQGCDNECYAPQCNFCMRAVIDRQIEHVRLRNGGCSRNVSL